MNKKIFLVLFFLISYLNAGFFDFLTNKIKEKAEKETLIKHEKIISKETNDINNEENTEKNNKASKKEETEEKKEENIPKINLEEVNKAKKNKEKKENLIKHEKIHEKEINNLSNNKKLENKEEKVITVKEKLKTLLNIKNTNIIKEKLKTKRTFKNNLEKEIKNINNNKYNNQENLLYYKYEIDKNIKKHNFKKVYYLFDKILSYKNISKKLKMKFADYIFWKILISYININEISKKEIKSCKKVLSHIINKMDVNYNLNTKIDKNIFDILQEKISSGPYFISFLNEYYPYGINDNILYSKFFRLFSSDLMAKNPYLKKIVLYLKDDFNNYFDNADDIVFDENLLDLYLQMLLKSEIFTGNTVLNIIKKYKYLNPLNSNVYYYLAMFSKINNYETETYENLLKTSIKYNVYNVKSWKALIQYLTEKRGKKFKKLKKEEKRKILKFDKYIIKLIDYIINNIEISNNHYSYFLMKKAKILYLEGTTFKDPEKLYESLIIYNRFKKCSIVEQIKYYIKIISIDFYEKKVKNIFCQ